MSEMQRVVEFIVSKAHVNQIRNLSGVPAVTHPMEVVSQLACWGIKHPVTWKAGYCHDVKEDCPHITHKELVEVIGKESVSVVDELTFVFDPKLPDDHKQQKAKYLESFRTKSLHALAVKMADRAVNSCDFLCFNPDYAKKYWRMASPLFLAFMERSDEVKEFFGEPTFAMMMHTRTTINAVFQ